MRTWGRIVNDDGSQTWVQVSTEANGSNDRVYLTTLCQVLLLNLNESPFFANFGIPSHQSVMSQIFPDFYIAFTQQQFAKHFASLLVSRRAVSTPVYDIKVVTHQGVVLSEQIPIPF